MGAEGAMRLALLAWLPLLAAAGELDALMASARNGTAPAALDVTTSPYDASAARRLMGDMGVVNRQCGHYLSLGGFHTCAVKVGGRAVCWGKNNFGQSNVPASIGTQKWISAGWHHSCAVNTSGVTNCWGRVGFYMRGAQYVPPEVTARRAKAVSAGYDHTCVLYEDNTPFCWGWGSELLGTDGYPQN